MLKQVETKCWKEGSSMKYKGFNIVQASNHHISLYKDGRRVMHVPANTQKNDDELKEIVEFYLQLQKGDAL